MANKNFKVDILSVSSIENLQKELQKYSDSLEYKARLIAEKLAERGVEVARVKIADLDAIFTGELISSVHSEYVGSQKGGAIFAVVTDSDHAAFVEFGTGIVGSAHPYTGKLPEGVTWEYAVGKTIGYLADGRYGWFYPADDGNWYFTEGMPSRPFMYFTAIELKTMILEIAQEVFANG